MSPEDHGRLQDLPIGEFEPTLDSPEPYAQFTSSVESLRDDPATLCKRIFDEGRVIHVYGASEKGNTVLQHAGSIRCHSSCRRPRRG